MAYVVRLRGDLEFRRVEFDGIESVGFFVFCSDFAIKCACDEPCVSELEVSALMHLVDFDACAGVSVLYLENQDGAILVVSQYKTSLIDIVQKKLHMAHLEELSHAIGVASNGVILCHIVDIL